MIQLVIEYKGDGEYLSVHHPDKEGAKDNAPDSTALMLLAAKEGVVGEIVIFVRNRNADHGASTSVGL